MSRQERDTAEYLAMLDRMIRAAGRRVAVGDVEDLQPLVDLADVLEEAIVAAVGGLKSSGVSWRAIGQATGTSHVAAIQKWADRVKVLTVEQEQR
jgi:hypothetical protein